MAESRSILDLIGAQLDSDQLKLPSYSPVAARIQAVAQRADCDARQIEQAILHDPALAGEVLRLANSAYYAGLAKAATLSQAIARLGLTEIVNLVILSTQGEQYKSSNPLIARWMATLWRHAMGCALGAKWLAERCGYRERAAEAFLAGLFHDIGKLLLLRVFDDLASGSARGAPLSEALMQEVLVAQHAAQGARLLRHWNLADAYIEIAGHHHDERVDDSKPLLAIVRLADLACTKLGINLLGDPRLVLTATQEAAVLGVNDVTIAELEITLEDALVTLARAA